MHNHYFLWALARFSMRFTAYFILLPIMVVLFPAFALCEALGKAYYHFTDW
jgi:hypothetical protein